MEVSKLAAMDFNLMARGKSWALSVIAIVDGEAITINEGKSRTRVHPRARMKRLQERSTALWRFLHLNERPDYSTRDDTRQPQGRTEITFPRTEMRNYDKKFAFPDKEIPNADRGGSAGSKRPPAAGEERPFSRGQYVGSHCGKLGTTG